LVRASYLEIYNEEIRDLLSKSPKNRLELHEKPDSGVYVRDLSYYAVKDVAAINEIMIIG
jgi:kinesin family protein 3/17